MKLVLATTSPSRIEVFTKSGIPFEAKGSNVDEYTADRPTEPEALVKYLSQLKTEAVAKECAEAIVIWFDSVAYFDGKILEKPKSRQEWFERLQAMSGKEFSYYTGIYAINLATQQQLSDCVITKAKLRAYDDTDINRYLDDGTDNYKTHAHGFNPYNQYSSTFIESIIGEPLNMIGTPIARIMKMIKDLWYKVE